MRGYLSVMGADVGTIPVESRVEIYRDEDDHTVLARTSGREHDLGICDVTVSRLRDGMPPIVIEPRQSYLEIHNKRNSNGLTVVCDGDETDLGEGLTTTVDDTAVVTVGYQTTIQLRVVREAKTEINVRGDVDGDVVAGDQTTLDERTQVVDSVVNRSDIGGDAGATVEDSVVNRSALGDSPQRNPDDESETQKHCEIHERMYSGEACPKCEKATPSVEAPVVETKYCLFCGAEIPEIAVVCPDCGERLPDIA